MKTKLDELRAMELYNEGLSDLDIAEQLGVLPATVRNWRNRTGHLKSHAQVAKPKIESSEAALRRDAAEANKRGVNYGALKAPTVEVIVPSGLVPHNASANLASHVDHPAHYIKGGIECITAISAAVEDNAGMEAVCVGNAIKYLWRWKQKNGIEDLQKARWYIDYLISRKTEAKQ